MTRKEWLAILLAVVVAGLWVHPYRAQQASRYALTAAIADKGTVVLDDYEHVLGIDRAVRDGRIYSDKAPGQPVLAVPFYLAYRAVGGEPADVLRIDGNLGVWWLTLWSAVVPLGALSVLMSRYLRRKGYEAVAWPVSLAVTYSTLLLPFGALLFGHVAAALGLFAMLYLVDRRDTSTRHLLGAGLLGGLAVSIEYTAVIGVVPILALATVMHRRSSGWVVLGGLPMAAALMVYNALAFGGPLVHSYRFSAFSSVTDEARPMLSMFSNPALENLWAILADPRGFLLATPVVVLGVVGLWPLWNRDRRVTITLGGITLGFLLVVVFWGNPWGGASPGPRYFTPALPFLCLPLALVWRRWRTVTLGVVTIGLVTMFLATATDPIVGRDEISGIGTWMRLFARGDVAPTVVGTGRWLVAMIMLAGSTVAFTILRSSAGGEKSHAHGEPVRSGER